MSPLQPTDPRVSGRPFTPTALAACALLLSLAGAGAVAQDARDEHFGTTIEVNVVNVDVRVTDGDGNPVLGLGPEDFEVFEDGEPMEITNFYASAEVTPGSFETPVPEAGGAEAGTPEAGTPEVGATPEAESPAPRDPAENLWLVVYVDNSNMMPNRRQQSLEAVRQFVRDDLSPRDQIMVVAFSDEVRVMDSFTTDRQRTLKALDAIDELPARGIQSRVEWRRNVDRLIDTFQSGRNGCEDRWEEMAAIVETYASETDGRSRAALGGLARMVGSLAGVKGRKALLYLSDGIAANPGAEGFQYLAELCPRRQNEAYVRMRDLDLARQLESIGSWANSARITFYTLETAGLQAPLSSGVDNLSLLFQPSQEVDSIRLRSLQDSLFSLAEQTGGKAALNANRLERPLEEISEDLEHYYSLGYAPEGPPDGERHEIEVRLTGEGRRDWQVRYRTGYRAKPREEVLADQVLAALLLNLDANPLEARISTGEMQRGEGKTRRVLVRISVPLDRLTLVPDGDGTFEARLRILLATTDGPDKVEGVRQRVLPIRIPLAQEADLAGKVHSFQIGVVLSRPKSRLAVGVVDEVSSVGSFGEVKLPG